VSFSGVGLLDRKGADENARILQVANQPPSPLAAAAGTVSSTQTPQPRSTAMSDADKQAAPEDAAKNAPGGGGGVPPAATPPPAGGPDKDAQIRQLQKENAALKQQVADLQKQLQQMEQEAKALTNKVRAESLVKKLEQKGLTFGSDDERTTEIDRLAGLSDEAFAAAEHTYERLAPQTTAEPEKPADAQASAHTRPLSTAANMRPKNVQDAPVSLEEQLRKGLGLAWADRNRHQTAAKE
jgi:adenine-specific DNA-methyltransferase